MDKELFLRVWEMLETNRPATLVLNDVFEDSPNIKGLTIDLTDNITLAIWEDGEVSIADYENM